MKLIFFNFYLIKIENLLLMATVPNVASNARLYYDKKKTSDNDSKEIMHTLKRYFIQIFISVLNRKYIKA